MPILIECPACLCKLSLADEFAGKKTRCPKCGDVFVAGASSSAQPARTSTDITTQPVARQDAAIQEPTERRRARRRQDDNHRDHDRRRRRQAGSVWPWLLGGVAAMAFFGCGALGAGWYLWQTIRPVPVAPLPPEAMQARFDGAPKHEPQPVEIDIKPKKPPFWEDARWVGPDKKMYLTDIDEQALNAGPLGVGKNGWLDAGGAFELRVKGKRQSNALGLAPWGDGKVTMVRYNLARQTYLVSGSVTLADSCPKLAGKVRFEIHGGQDHPPGTPLDLLWTSSDLTKPGESVPFAISTGGLPFLELTTRYLDADGQIPHAVWLEACVSHSRVDRLPQPRPSCNLEIGEPIKVGDFQVRRPFAGAELGNSCWHPDGNRYFCGHGNIVIRFDRTRPAKDYLCVSMDSSWLAGLAGNELVIAYNQYPARNLFFYDAETMRPTKVLDLEPSAVLVRILSPRAFLLNAYSRRSWYILDPQTGKSGPSIAHPTDLFEPNNRQQIIASPEGKYFYAVSGQGRRFRLHRYLVEGSTLSLENTIDLPNQNNLLSLSPDGKWLCAYSRLSSEQILFRTDNLKAAPTPLFTPMPTSLSLGPNNRLYVFVSSTKLHVLDYAGKILQTHPWIDGQHWPMSFPAHDQAFLAGNYLVDLK